MLPARTLSSVLASHLPLPLPGEALFWVDCVRTAIIVLGLVGMAHIARLMWLGRNPPPGWRARMLYCVLSLPPLVGTQLYQFGHEPVWWRLIFTVAALIALWWGMRSLDPRWIGASPAERDRISRNLTALEELVQDFRDRRDGAA